MFTWLVSFWSCTVQASKELHSWKCIVHPEARCHSVEFVLPPIGQNFFLSGPPILIWLPTCFHVQYAIFWAKKWLKLARQASRQNKKQFTSSLTDTCIEESKFVPRLSRLGNWLIPVARCSRLGNWLIPVARCELPATATAVMHTVYISLSLSLSRFHAQRKLGPLQIPLRIISTSHQAKMNKHEVL